MKKLKPRGVNQKNARGPENMSGGGASKNMGEGGRKKK